MLIRVFDFETTGFPPGAAVIEAGWTDVIIDGNIVEVGKTTSMLVNPFDAAPQLEMSIGALSTHHIQKADLIGAPAPEVVFRTLSNGADAFAAHNIEFDSQFFTGGGKPMICTFKAALHLWPDAEKHQNQFLRYLHNLPVDREIAEMTHRAGPDSHVTAHLLKFILGHGVEVDTLIAWTQGEKPLRILKAVPFGEHRGKPFNDVPSKYLNWIVRTITDKPDVVHTARACLRSRGEL